MGVPTRCFANGVEFDRLTDADRLYIVVQQFAITDLHPDQITDHEMGLLFEELGCTWTALAGWSGGIQAAIALTSGQ